MGCAHPVSQQNHTEDAAPNLFTCFNQPCVSRPSGKGWLNSQALCPTQHNWNTICEWVFMAAASQSNPYSLVHALGLTKRSLLSSSSSFSHPLSYSVDQLREGKVLVWNLRTTCRARKQRERRHRALSCEVRRCSEGQLITVRISVNVHGVF